MIEVREIFSTKKKHRFLSLIYNNQNPNQLAYFIIIFVKKQFIEYHLFKLKNFYYKKKI